MKHIRNLMTLLIAMITAITMSSTVYAVTPDALPQENTGTITVNNAARGETYKAFKILDAEVGANKAIVYKGTIPPTLTNYFKVNDAGEITLATNVTDQTLFTALKSYVDNEGLSAVDTIVANSETVVFNNLAFGYYVITSSQGNGAAISVTSTNPDGIVNEKNESTVTVTKNADSESYSIGDTVTYTVQFNGVNYRGSDDNAKIVTSYTVTDTLPAYLSTVTITEIKINNTPQTINETNFEGVTTFATGKTFKIPWARWNGSKWESLYNNGTSIVITYTAKLTDVVRVGDNNTNTVTIKPNVGKDDGTEEPHSDFWNDDAVIKTYATAVKKVDGSKKPLAGAKFKIAGLTATGATGVYTVTAYDPDNITLANSTEMEVDANGMLYIVGLKDSQDLSLTETVAPTGYNRLENAVMITSQKQTTEIIKRTGYRKYDTKGNIIEEKEEELSGGVTVEVNLSDLDATAIEIENNAGTVLPSTGGIGTTIFYIVGAILVAGAGIMLVTRRRVNAD